MPTRLSAAAVASPPMPAPTIATESGLAIASPTPFVARLELRVVLLSWPESGLLQRRASLIRAERIKKGLHRQTLFARYHQREVIMLFRQRNETEADRMGDRRNGHAPVGAVLRDGGRHGVVRTRLVPIAFRARTAEQPVDQDARAGALVAVDHDAGGIGERGGDGLLRAQAFKALIAFPEHDALHPPPARHELEDRKSTRLNSSHVKNSYAVFCLKK